jgi:hypothetical protein
VPGHCHIPADLPSRKRAGAHYTGGWVDIRACLDGSGKSRPIRVRLPETSSPVTSRYTDCTTRMSAAIALCYWSPVLQIASRHVLNRGKFGAESQATNTRFIIHMMTEKRFSSLRHEIHSFNVHSPNAPYQHI